MDDTNKNWPEGTPGTPANLPEIDSYKAEDYPDDPSGKPPKDDQPSFMGVTKGGKYVSLGQLDEAQAEEDAEEAAERDAAGDRMRQDVEAAAHPKH